MNLTGDSDSDSDDAESNLSPEEVQELTISLNEVLFDFLLFLDQFSLKRSVESMEVTIQQLVSLTHLETSKINQCSSWYILSCI